MSAKSPLTARELVDEYFIENRTRVLEIAAFLDRLDRADASYATGDFRMKAFADALQVLQYVEGTPAGGGSRLDRIQHLLSDPRTEPLDALDRKSALGAYDRWGGKEVGS
jgi:hypothetical protein